MDSTPSWSTFTELTIAGRFRWDSTSSFTAFYRPSSGSVQHVWWDRDGTKIRIISHHPSVGDVRMYTGSAGWDDNVWKQFVWRYKAATNTAQMWISDGTNMSLEASTTSHPGTGISVPTSPPRIGPVDGFVDHVCMYANYQTAASFYQNGCFLDPPGGALFHYVGAESTLTDVPDQRGNGQDATAGSGVTISTYDECP